MTLARAHAPAPCEHRGVSAPAAYVERLHVPRWWHVVSPVFALVLGGEALLTDHAAIAAAVIAGVWVLAETGLWSLGRREVSVLEGKVRAGGWRLPVTQVRGVALLDAREMRAEQRRHDPGIYRCTVPWVPGGVLLDVDDPGDAALWLVSTRHPRAFADALAGASQASAPSP